MADSKLDDPAGVSRRRLDTVLSLRLDQVTAAALAAKADRHGYAASELLRACVERLVAMTAVEIRDLMMCGHCGGTGKRPSHTGEPASDP